MRVAAYARSSLRAAGAGMGQAPFPHLVAIITLALALFALGSARLGGRVLDALIASVSTEVELVLYLRGDGDAAAKANAPAEGKGSEAFQVAERLKARSAGEVKIVSPDEALARLAHELDDLGPALKALPRNPLPASIEMRLPGAVSDPTALRKLAQEARGWPEVTAVDDGREAVERLSHLIGGLRFASGALLVLVAMATVVVVSATIQLAIEARRQEIEIQKLVGATNRFVQAPFLIEGIFQGLLGAVIAAVGLWAAESMLGARLGDLVSFLSGPMTIAPAFDRRLFLELCGCGSLLGLLGSGIGVGRFLNA